MRLAPTNPEAGKLRSLRERHTAAPNWPPPPPPRPRVSRHPTPGATLSPSQRRFWDPRARALSPAQCGNRLRERTRAGTYLPPPPPGTAGVKARPPPPTAPTAAPSLSPRSGAPSQVPALTSAPALRLPAGARPRLCRRPRPSTGGRVTIPVAGGSLTVTAPESGGDAPLVDLDPLAQPRGPAQARRHAAPSACGPASASGSRLPRPRPGFAPPLAATPCFGRFARFPPRPRAASAAGPAASHWLRQLLGDEQPRPALAPGASYPPPPFQKNLEKKKTLSPEPERDAGAAAAAAPVTPCDSPGRVLLPAPSLRRQSWGPWTPWAKRVVVALRRVFRASVNPSTHPRSKSEAPRRPTCAGKSGEINHTTAGTQN